MHLVLHGRRLILPLCLRLAEFYWSQRHSGTQLTETNLGRLPLSPPLVHGKGEAGNSSQRISSQRPQKTIWRLLLHTVPLLNMGRLNCCCVELAVISHPAMVKHIPSLTQPTPRYGGDSPGRDSPQSTSSSQLGSCLIAIHELHSLPLLPPQPEWSGDFIILACFSALL